MGTRLNNDIHILLCIKWKALCLAYIIQMWQSQAETKHHSVVHSTALPHSKFYSIERLLGAELICVTYLSGNHASMLRLVSFIGTFQSFEHPLVSVCLNKRFPTVAIGEDSNLKQENYSQKTKSKRSSSTFTVSTADARHS